MSRKKLGTLSTRRPAGQTHAILVTRVNGQAILLLIAPGGSGFSSLRLAAQRILKRGPFHASLPFEDEVGATARPKRGPTSTNK